MSKVTKKDLNERLLMVETLLGLHRVLPEQISNDQANNAIFRMQCALSRGKELAERKPQLKQLDQSIFDGLDEKWRFAAVDGNKGFPIVYEFEPYAFESGKYYTNRHGLDKDLTHLTGYDTSNWQNSLIERDTAKELAEVDLSSELTGSELCKAMLARGDKYVMCAVSDISESDAILSCNSAVITSGEIRGAFTNSFDGLHEHAVPINNQGEPLTAIEAGL